MKLNAFAQKNNLPCVSSSTESCSNIVPASCSGAVSCSNSHQSPSVYSPIGFPRNLSNRSSNHSQQVMVLFISIFFKCSVSCMFCLKICQMEKYKCNKSLLLILSITSVAGILKLLVYSIWHWFIIRFCVNQKLYLHGRKTLHTSVSQFGDRILFKFHCSCWFPVTVIFLFDTEMNCCLPKL
jgi:hypothetical protein